MTEPVPADGEESQRGNTKLLSAQCGNYAEGREVLDEQLPAGWRIMWVRMLRDE